MNEQDNEVIKSYSDRFEETHAACYICGEPAADGDQIDWWPCCSKKCLSDFLNERI